jgi:hypothetical protein
MIWIAKIYRLGTGVYGYDSVKVAMDISIKSYKLGMRFNNIDSAQIRNF